MQFETVATELFGLSPAEFTAARNERAAEAKREGDRDLAEHIRGLPKPSASAWVVNMLVRHRAEQIDGVIELGASLRSAQQDLDAEQLRTLSGQRSRLIAAVAVQGRDLAEELGHATSDAAVREVEQTLQAAMADPDAASAVRSGCLLRSLSSSGVEPADLTDAVAIPIEDSRALTSVRDIRAGSKRRGHRSPDVLAREQHARDLEDARRALDDAERLAEDAATARDDAGERISRLGPRREKLLSELDELEERISEIGSQIVAVDRETRALQRERDRASRAADEAQSAADRASKRLSDLT